MPIPGDYQFRALHHGHPIQRAWHRGKLEAVRRIAPPAKGSLVLDAGCGSGVLTDMLAGMGARVLGVDWSAKAIEFARDAYGRPGVDFICASLLDFQGGPFDAVYCLECVEHFPPEEVVLLLKRLASLVDSEGRLFLTTPNYLSAWPALEGLLDLLNKTPRMKGEQHQSPMTPRRLGRHLEAGGWRILEMGSFNGLAPFASAFSESLARLLRNWEFRRPTGLLRNLLYVLGEPVKS